MPILTRVSYLIQRPAFFFFFLSSFVAFFCGVLWAQPLSSSLDHSEFTAFLKKYVNEKGEVDYKAVKQDPSSLKKYLQMIASKERMQKFNEWPREERMAVLINAYHAGMIDQIQDHYPVREVSEIPNFWEQHNVAIGKSKTSLNALRKQLMMTFRDAKVHMVLSWASRGGPRLRQEALTGPMLEGQIFMATRGLVNDPFYVRIEPGRKKIEISRIFQWYGEDFMFAFPMRENDRGFGDIEFSVLSFLVYYLEDTEKIRYLEDEKFKIKYLPFDWSLNDWKKE